jgi:hypothetical protein
LNERAISHFSLSQLPNLGFFIPTHGQVEADIASLKKASKTLDRLLAAKSIDVDAVVAEFKTARKRSSTRKKSP